MTFYEVIIENLKRLNTDELINLRSNIDSCLGGSKMKEVATGILKEQGVLPAVKYVRDRTEWNLRYCKAYIDGLKNEKLNNDGK